MEKRYQECIDILEQEAKQLEEWLKQQSSAYLQIEDMGSVSTKIRTLRSAAEILRQRQTLLLVEG